MSGVSVKITELKKQFNGREVLKGISFECEAGESVSILGESGMGKSVMMKIIGMLIEATSGSVKIGEQEIVGITEINMEKTMKNIGFLFQSSALFDNLTVWENIVFYQLFNEKMNEEDAKEISHKIAYSLSIPENVMNLKPSEISGGMQRRVALARTIAKQPQLILLDEPTNSIINKTKKKNRCHYDYNNT